MKFAEHLAAHITPEWRKQYIQYESMKEMIYDAVEQAPSPEMSDQDVIQRYFARFDESFFQFCDMELLKINTFFSEKLSEASRKFANLKSELTLSEEAAAARPTRKLTLRKRRGSLHSALIKKSKKIKENDPDRQFPLPNRSDSSDLDVKWKSDKPEKEKTLRKMHDIKLAFSEFYLSCILLQNYQTLNFTGFRKILKKHDKLLDCGRGAQWRQGHVETAPFYTSKSVDHLIKETETVFTQQLEGGNRQKAMKRLRVPPLGEKQNPWTTFRVGFFSGIFIVLWSVGVISAMYTDHANNWQPALRFYRGTFLVILCTFLLGINTYGWRASGVNHVLIFELDPRDHLTHQQLLEVAGFFAVIWALSVLTFLFSDYIGVPVFASPLILVSFCLLYLINPIKILHYKARRWLLRVLLRIMTAPFHHVGFADFWLADQLNSLTTVLLDFEFLICFYALEVNWLGTSTSKLCGSVSYGVRPLVACLPAWFRFAQCLRRYRDTRLVFPHIVNAGKYSTTFFVVLFSTLNSVYKEEHGEEVIQNNAFYILWVTSAAVSTCYTFIWDVRMDWGLLDRNAGENTLLREEIVYAYKGYYYFAIIEDFILRFAWTVTVSIGEGGFLHNEILTSILASLEVFRRFTWNFFRLENEHLNNCGQFRAVRDISIAPLDANDSTALEEMMDDEDGVLNRRTGDKRRLTGTRTTKKIWVDDDDDD